MRIHVLAGCRDLLQPEILPPEMAADLIGPGVMLAQAGWIFPECGDRYHDFLQEKPGDRRVAVMAEALKDGFGTRFEPLLVLADLLDEMQHDSQRPPATTVEDRRTQYEVLAEILASGHVRQLQLHGIALPAKADPDGSWAVPAGIVPGTVRDRIERLRSAVTADTELDAVETRVVEVIPDFPVFNTTYNNALSSQFARRLQPRLIEHGWTLDTEALASAIIGILLDWNSKGMFAGLPLCASHFDGMVDLLYERLLRG